MGYCATRTSHNMPNTLEEAEKDTEQEKGKEGDRKQRVPPTRQTVNMNYFQPNNRNTTHSSGSQPGTLVLR